MKSSAYTDTPISEQLRREAQAWLRCLKSGRATEQDAEAFLRWRAIGPGQEAAFAEAQRGWHALGPAIQQLQSSERANAARARQRDEAPASWGRRAFMGGAVMGAAALAGAALFYPPLQWWPSLGEMRADYRTERGEQRQIALSKDVDVDLNTLTAITRQQVGGRTAGIVLLSGEAAIDVKSPTDGFSVSAGAGRSIAQVGRFEVRHIDGETTCVTCVQGTLRVEHPQGARSLSAGEQLVYRNNAIGNAESANLAVVSAWRKGILVFNQTPVAQVIDEINRYRPGHVVLMNDSVRQRKMSGYFSIHSLDAVLLQIQRTYRLDTRELPGGLVLLS